MNFKSFILGLVTGIIITFVGLYLLGLANQGTEKTADNNGVQYLDTPVSYENKVETSFQIIQVLGDAALASEVSDEEYDLYLGNTVMIVGNNFYTDQIVKVRNPKRIGSYSYISKGDRPLTVPVIEGEIE